MLCCCWFRWCQLISVLAPITQRSICYKRTAARVQTKGSSSTARLQLEPKAVASRARMRPVHTALPLLPLPPPDQCQPMGFLTPFRLLVSDLFGSHWLPAACPTFLGAHISTLHCKLPQVSSTVHCTSSWHLLQAQLWLASFYRCQVFMLEGTYLSNCSCLLYVLSHLVTPFHTTWCRVIQTCLIQKLLHIFAFVAHL